MIKASLLQLIKDLVETRMDTAWQAMQNAQASANEESKSSAGDKYETGRAMGQLDREMYGRQYDQAYQERASLERINSDQVSTHVTLGSLVQTSVGNYFIAVSVGKITHYGYDFLVVSPLSPVGQQLLGKRVGDKLMIQGKAAKIIAMDALEVHS